MVHMSEEGGTTDFKEPDCGGSVEENMKAKQPLEVNEGSSTSEGSTTKIRSFVEGSPIVPTATAQTVPFIGTELAFTNAAVVAFINVAMRLEFHPRPALPVPLPVSLPHKACATSCINVRGCCESNSAGVKMDLRVLDIDLASVPGNEARGRMKISSVACDGFSDAGRTSTGPETETMDSV
ncbi:unnamed protein product [Somion occarium]|uniref:Uncharacterized protein n=1 Tax=Somion occarium TaxID=3059160 RepID=A0ABP1CT64_9APHY